MDKYLAELAEATKFWLPALIGGLVDYTNQVVRKTKRRGLVVGVTHIATAVFFGWMSATLVTGLDYAYDVAAASGGLGGYMGLRTAELLSKRFSVKGS